MASGYIRQSTANIQPNLEINAGDHNAEYDAIAATFDNTTGHDHSGSATGVGAKISMTASVTGTLPIANGGTALATIGTAGQLPISNGTILVYGNVGFNTTFVAGPTTTASLVGVHLGSGYTYALSKTTRIMMIIQGVMGSNANGCGAIASIRYGTGAAPAADAAITGTDPGGEIYFNNPATDNSAAAPFNIIRITSGLTIGTTYWIDVIKKALTGGTANFGNIVITVLEI